ncbi:MULTISPECIES: acyltransferase family protein [unclassified Arthrobacter]|uniref:acyltransferase family protein n=1 Tax=unclassified Arthrobacter TaxID=235627 RepID=UPI001491E622|nr:acyltransferase family protein [Arthrobacter sp. AET 35A]MBE0010126.1 acyltransferase [Arthrobacter sp. AET 35A]NOJ64091.1 acyltransferase [Arthrobacter sp. 147(2020)]
MGSALESRQDQKAFRPEVEGLRAVAVLMVVVYHVWLDRVSGGVDVFLLISAFLLTLSFTHRVDTKRPFELVGRWVRMFGRLVPAAVIVLLATIAAALVIFPQARWGTVIDHSWASLLYVQNWALALGAVEYQEAGAGVSPMQHFWSLSIQGQVFILWPLLLVGCAAAARALRSSFRVVAGTVFTTVFIISLSYSISETLQNQPFAYFDTRTRLWEFALGSLLALALPWLRPYRLARVAMGWIGILAIALCGSIIPVADAFPGYVALVPTIGAVLVITAGQSGSKYGVERILSASPVLRLGAISYALYLWHWPILISYLVASGSDHVSVGVGAAIIAASIVLAAATTRLVERPLRSWRWIQRRRRRQATLTVALTLMVAVPLTGWETQISSTEHQLASQPSELNPGAAVLVPGYPENGVPDAAPIPAATDLGNEWGNAGPACGPDYRTIDPAMERCHQIEPEGDPEKTIIVIGDSHAQQLMAAIGPIAVENNWRVVSVLKDACRYGGESAERDEDCNEFNSAARDYALDKDPDAILTLGTLTYTDGPRESLVPDYQAGIQPFLNEGIEVISIRDNPRFPFNMFECAEVEGIDAAQCNPDREEVLLPENPADLIATSEPLFHSVDLTDRICTETTCPAMVGNVYVYRDFDHLNRSYVETMIPDLEQRLLEETGW